MDINESSDTEGTSRARIGETSLRTEHIQINLRPEATVEASVADGANTASQQSSLSYRREGQSSQHLTENRPVCKFYRRGRCKYGISGKKDGTCMQYHPKPCKKFLENGTRRRGGCTRVSDCRFFHPSVCYSSLQERICLNENCKYVHIKGTRRFAQPQTETVADRENTYRHQNEARAREENTDQNISKHPILASQQERGLLIR